MQIVDKPLHHPGRCLASLKSEDREGFIDTGLEALDMDPVVFTDPHIYISVTWLKEQARKLGMVEGEQVEDLRREVSDLKAEVAEADRFAENVEYTLSHLGGRVKSKPGPRKAKAVKE